KPALARQSPYPAFSSPPTRAEITMVALQADGITFRPRRFSRSLHFSRINYIFLLRSVQRRPMASAAGRNDRRTRRTNMTPSTRAGVGAFEFPYITCRNISAPEDDTAGRKVYSGHAPASSVLSLEDDENVREYIVHAQGTQKPIPTLVHQA